MPAPYSQTRRTGGPMSDVRTEPWWTIRVKGGWLSELDPDSFTTVTVDRARFDCREIALMYLHSWRSGVPGDGRLVRLTRKPRGPRADPSNGLPHETAGGKDALMWRAEAEAAEARATEAEGLLDRV